MASTYPLPTKEERQIAKLELAQTKRQLVGKQSYRELRYYDLDLLPTKYSGDGIVNNPNVGGLVAGRPWKTTPNVLSGLWRSQYNGYFEADWTWFDTQTPIASIQVNDFTFPDGGDSYQWLGYFKAPHTANYTFYLESDDRAQFWLGDKAITGYNDGNWDVYSDAGEGESSTDPISLTAGQYYPIRLQYGDAGGNSTLNFSWSDDYNIETTGLVMFLNAASGWDGGITWINEPALEQSSFNATTLNYPTLDTTGGITSMLYNGISNYWDVTNPTSGDFSVGVWFNTTSTAGTGAQFFNNPQLVGSDTAGPANDWGLCIKNGQIGFGGGSGQTAFTTPAFNNGVWHYVVATRVQTTGAMTIFVDGVQLAQITEAPGEVLNTTPIIRIGNDALGSSRYYQGRIAEVQFYQIALAPVQILSNFDIERSTYGV
jgi:hypothetical protein